MRGSWVVVLALAASASSYANIIGTLNPEFRHSYVLHPNGRVVIQNLYGDVAITAWDRDEVLVQAIKKSSDPRLLDDAQIVVDASSDLLSIRTQYGGTDSGHPASVDFRIMVPRAANLANIRLINGGLSISGITGPVKASSVNGSIRAERLKGQADLSTVNGVLEAGFERVSRAHPITLSSVNGPIKLWLPGDASASLEAHNLSGGIDSEFGRAWRGPAGHQLHAMMHRGGARIRVSNVNGGISIRALGRWS
jgi:Toastrack DUF4097